MTNFEKIKTMNVDEMAERFRRMTASASCRACQYNGCGDDSCYLHETKEEWEYWLESEVEEDDKLCENHKQTLKFDAETICNNSEKGLAAQYMPC